MSIPAFLKQKGESLYYNGEGEFIFFVPEEYFDINIAVIEGEFVRIIGILDYSIARKPQDILKKVVPFNFPTMFYTKPGSIEKVKDLKILPNSTPGNYRLLKYENNDLDQIVVSTKVPQDITNVEDFFRIFVKTGKIPKSIPYDRLYEYFLESIELNGASYGISGQLFGLIMELCRDPSNMENPFRLSKAINESMLGYKTVSIATLPKYISPFVSITSENWNESIVGAIMNDNHKDSPLEKVVMK